MSRWPNAAAALGLALTLAAARAEVPKPAPDVADLVLALAQLQDAVAAGHGEAMALQRAMMGQISAGLLRQDPYRLPEPRTLRAAVIYVLSGGQPSDVATLLNATPGNDLLHWLLQGAVHYGLGEKDKTLAIFQLVDPVDLPRSIGGRIALAEAMLLPEAEAVERARLLNFATRLMPGTLVEEAALRRLCTIATAAGDTVTFQSTAERYLRAFPASLFAGEFIKSYGEALVAFEEQHRPVPRQAVEDLLNAMPQDRRRELYLDVAGQATRKGLGGLALFAAARARRLAPEGSRAWHFATLYDAAIRITGPDYEVAEAMLKDVDATSLDAEGRDILAASLRLAAAIRDPGALFPETGAPDAKAPLPADQLAIVAKAGQALQSADELLKGIAE